MQLLINGYNLPGCVLPQPDGALMTNVHVAVQIGREPSDLVKADSSKALWDLDIEAFVREGQLEFRAN